MLCVSNSRLNQEFICTCAGSFLVERPLKEANAGRRKAVVWIYVGIICNLVPVRLCQQQMEVTAFGFSGILNLLIMGPSRCLAQ